MAQAKTVIGIPIRSTDERNIDRIVERIGENIRGLDRNAFTLVIDTNGTTDELNQYFSAKLRPLRAHMDIAFHPHTQADGRTASMNRIAAHALESESGLNGVIYMNDPIVAGPETIRSLARGIQKHPIAGAFVRPEDTRGKESTSLSRMAQLDFEYRLRKKQPHLHGAMFGLAASELLDMQKGGFFPAVHFDDDYLTVRHKLKHGMDANIPILDDCPAFTSLPGTWPDAINKVARYVSGERQLADFFEQSGKAEVAKILRGMGNNGDKAAAQFRTAYDQARKVADNEPVAAASPDVDYLLGLWSQMKPNGAPPAEELRDTLEKLVLWDEQKQGYTVRSPEVTLPLLNSIINLLGVCKAETGFALAGSSWDCDEQPEKLRNGPLAEPKIKSAIPQPVQRVGIAY